MFFIHSSVDGHLGGFSFLAVRNYPAMKGGVLVFVSSCVFISLGYTPGSGIMKSFNFLKNHQTVFTVSQWLHYFTFPPAMYGSSCSSPFSPKLVIVQFFIIIAILLALKSK